MTAYLAIIVLLFLFACAENGRFESKYPGRISCLTLILFGGLRHETGFDWVEYENYYNLILPISASRPEYITYNLLVEPGFQFFCLILRSLGASFQTFLFVVTFVITNYLFYLSFKFYEPAMFFQTSIGLPVLNSVCPERH